MRIHAHRVRHAAAGHCGALGHGASAGAQPVWFLPYLSGKRTPHNNPQAQGAFFGLTHQHGRPELARAVLEGIGFALAQRHQPDAARHQAYTPRREVFARLYQQLLPLMS